MAQLGWSHAHECFSEAVGGMAASTDPLRKRLENAFISHLLHLLPDELPEELRERFEKVRQAVTEKPAKYPDEGTLHATLREMSPKRAKKLIQEIVSIEFLLAHVYHTDE